VDTLGRDLKGDFPAVRAAILGADEALIAEWGKALLSGGKISVPANGKTFDLGADQVIVQQTGAEGYAVAEGGGYLAALKTDLSEALIQEGLAREVVRRIQNWRKEADLDISDRIEVQYQASERLGKAIQAFQEYISGETLAFTLNEGAPTNGEFHAEDEFDGEQLSISLRRQA
jgi:isoleucyl-tRNA synthetase